MRPSSSCTTRSSFPGRDEDRSVGLGKGSCSRSRDLYGMSCPPSRWVSQKIPISRWSSTPDASNGLFSLASCAGPTSCCLPHSLLSSVSLMKTSLRDLRCTHHGHPSVLDVNALVLTVGPGSKASRRKLLRICDHHTSMYLQMRAPTPTVQSCGKCILHTRNSVAYATPPVCTYTYGNVYCHTISDATRYAPCKSDRCAQPSRKRVC